MAMLPHGTMMGMPNSDVPALHLVGIHWNHIYGGYETQASTGREEYQVEDSGEYFKAIAKRNGIKVSSPAQDEIHGATANLSPVATEFVPRHAPAEEIPKTSQLIATVAPSPLPSSADIRSPNEDKKLLEMFQEILSEKKQQFKILQECMKDREESKSTVSSLTATKTALADEVEKLTCDLAKLKERNAMYSEEVEVLTDRLIELEEDNTRLKWQVATLTNKLNEKENESNQTMVLQLKQAEDERDRANNTVDRLVSKYEVLVKEKESFETKVAMLADQINKNNLEKESFETKAALLSEQVHKSNVEKERTSTRSPAVSPRTLLMPVSSLTPTAGAKVEILNLTSQLEYYRCAKEREKETAAAAVEDDPLPGSSKMDSLDHIAGLDDDQNWTVVKRTKGLKSTKTSHGFAPHKTDAPGIKLELKRSKSLDSTPLAVQHRNGFHSSDEKYPKIEEKVIPPLMQLNLEPVNGNAESYFTDSQYSDGHSEFPTRPCQVPRRTSVDLNTQQEIPSSNDFRIHDNPETSNIERVNSIHEKPSSSITSVDIPLASVGMSATHPSSQSIPPEYKVPTFPCELKSSSRSKDKDQTKFSPFEMLIKLLTERFPSKTRSELMVLLKLAKTTFGDQGFRKKKMEEIVTRVGEIILPEDMEKETEISANICSICRDELEVENETLLECGHAFHTECVKEWISTERTCPLCRSHALTEEDFPTLT